MWRPLLHLLWEVSGNGRFHKTSKSPILYGHGSSMADNMRNLFVAVDGDGGYLDLPCVLMGIFGET